MGLLGVLVVDGTPTIARAGNRSGRNLELGEGSPEIQACAADHHRCPAGCERRVDRGVRERLELGDRGLVVERPDCDQGGG
jgi:hypothetical protein